MIKFLEFETSVGGDPIDVRGNPEETIGVIALAASTRDERGDSDCGVSSFSSRSGQVQSRARVAIAGAGFGSRTSSGADVSCCDGATIGLSALSVGDDIDGGVLHIGGSGGKVGGLTPSGNDDLGSVGNFSVGLNQS